MTATSAAQLIEVLMGHDLIRTSPLICYLVVDKPTSVARGTLVRDVGVVAKYPQYS